MLQIFLLTSQSISNILTVLHKSFIRLEGRNAAAQGPLTFDLWLDRSADTLPSEFAFIIIEHFGRVVTCESVL